MLIISLVIIGLIISLVKSVGKDWTKIMDNNNKIEELNKKYSNLLLEEEKLSSEVTKLQDSDYVARYAKEKYMYSADGETIIRIH